MQLPTAIEMVATATLVPYAKNARTHSQGQVAEIAASMREFGWTSPILINDRSGIIAGHGRILAAQQLAMDEVPCIRLGHLTAAQERALVIADNKLALNAGWDLDILKGELSGLMSDGFDMPILGFSPDDLAGILGGNSGATDPDDVPDALPVPVTIAGNVWLMGAHRLICGDSTDPATVEAVLLGAKPHLMVTDPPYGVEYDPKWRVGLHRTKRDGSPLEKPAYAAIGDVQNDHRADWREAWAHFDGDTAYVWTASLHVHESAEGLEAAGFVLRSQIIWAKPHFSIGRGDYHWKHEPCWYAVRNGRKSRWNGDRKQTTIWEITSGVGFTTQKVGKDARTGHGTQKPVECMRRPMENNSKVGDAVYEPFSGSGTTIIAGEITGRRVLAIELNPTYVDVAVARWQAFAGKIAVLEGDGRTFDDVAAARTAVDAS